jgi:high-affinity nickel permease
MQALLVGLALLLGIKHAFDADHLVAVGNVLTRARDVGHSVRLGLWWALGHLLTAGAISLVLFYGKSTLWPGLVARLDVLVPVMLILVGLWGLLVATRRVHAHRHAHGERAHTHLHVHVSEAHGAKAMGGIGLVHGLASNDELLLILGSVLGATTATEVIALVGVFSLGVVVGMSAYAAALRLAVSEDRRPAAAWWANVVLSVASIAYAFWLLTGRAGLNLLPVGP